MVLKEDLHVRFDYKDFVRDCETNKVKPLPEEETRAYLKRYEAIVEEGKKQGFEFYFHLKEWGYVQMTKCTPPPGSVLIFVLTFSPWFGRGLDECEKFLEAIK